MSNDNVVEKKIKIKTSQQTDQGMGTMKEEQQNVATHPVNQPCKPPPIYALTEEYNISNSGPVTTHSAGNPPVYLLTQEYSVSNPGTVTTSQPCEPPIYVLTEEYNVSNPGPVNVPAEPTLYVLAEEHKKSYPRPVGIPVQPPFYVLTQEYNKPVCHPVVLAKQSPMNTLTEDCQCVCSQPLPFQSPTCGSREDFQKPCHSTLLTYALATEGNQNQFNSHSKSVVSPLNKHFSFTVLDPGHLDGPCSFHQRPTSFDEYIQCYQQQTCILQQYEQLYQKQYQALQAYQNLVQEFQQSQGKPYQLKKPSKDPPPSGSFCDTANKTQITVSALPRPEDTFKVKESQQRSKPLETNAITSQETDESSLLCYDVHVTITPNGQPHCSSPKKDYPKYANAKSKMCPPVAPSPLPMIITDERNNNISLSSGKVSPNEENKHQGLKTRSCSMTQSQHFSIEEENDNEWRSSPLSLAEIKRNSLRSRRQAHPTKGCVDHN